MDADRLLGALGPGLGAWSYAVVGVLAFLETSAFVGLVAPGELAVIVGGVLAGRGQMEYAPLLAIVWGAALAGDATGFLLGRRLGRPFLIRHGARFGVTDARLRRVERFFADHGAKAIVIGRFVGVVRALGPFTAGASGMRLRPFVIADVIGSGLWAVTFTALGYIFASNVGGLLSRLHDAQLGVGVALAAAAGLWLLRRRRRRTAGGA
jgi:membrane protein DedA with SNARE-associated domain